MSKISVIVPVYNAEKYISRCVDSVFAQTYSNWELLLIDDGSKDDSLTILNSFALKDYRVRVIHQENAGAGAARNVGIENASGDYIVFIDSDDFIEPDYFSRIVEKNTDIVFIDANQRNELGRIIKTERLSEYKNSNKDDILRSQMTGKMLWGGWRKSVKADIIKSHNIRFSQHKVGEEALYSFLVLYFANSYSFIDKPVYNYILHDDSLSQTMLDDPWGEVSINMKDRIIEMGLYSEYADTLNGFFVRAAVGSLYKLVKKYNYLNYRKKAVERIHVMKSLIDYEYKIDMKHVDKRARLIYPLINLNLISIVFVMSRAKSILGK